MCLPQPACACQRIPGQNTTIDIGYDLCTHYQQGWDIKDPARGNIILQQIITEELKLELEGKTIEHGSGLIMG